MSEQEWKEAFLIRAGFRHGWYNLESWARQMVDQAYEEAGLERAKERVRINDLLGATREHWIKSNGKNSISVSVLDVIAEVIADGSYVKHV